MLNTGESGEVWYILETLRTPSVFLPSVFPDGCHGTVECARDCRLNHKSTVLRSTRELPIEAVAVGEDQRDGDELRQATKDYNAGEM